MGFNTVALILNDFMHELKKSPHSLTFAICHPPNSSNEKEMACWLQQVASVAKEHNEPYPARQLGGGLKILPTFHADDKHLLIAGWNQLSRAGEKEKVTVNDINGKKYMTVLLPEWWNR